MRIALEKIRDNNGNLRDVKQIPLSKDSFFEKAGLNSYGYTWVQWIDGRPVEAFTDEEILVIEL